MSRLLLVASTRHTGNQRRAVTLVELVVVMSVMGLLLATLSTVVTRVLRRGEYAGPRARHRCRIATSGSVSRDVHGATRVVVPNDSSSHAVHVESDAQVIEYAMDTQQIQRSVAVESGVPSRRNFYLPAGVTADFQSFSVQDRPFVRLRLTASGRSLLEYVAQIGRDRRFVDRVDVKQP